MGERGPPPTPTSILNLRGSWRGKARKNEPTPEAGTPECPRWLSGKARHMWHKIAPQLEAMRVATKIDTNALARYCQLWGRWREAEEWLMEHGDQYPVKTWNSVTETMEVVGFREFPKVRIAASLADQLARLEKEFGLTPSSRARITVADHEETKDAKLEEKKRFLGMG